jgi:signal transduction histidine kinase
MAAEDQTADRRDGPASKDISSPAEPLPALLRLARRSVLVTAVVGLAAVCATAGALWQLRQHHLDASVRNLQHVARGLAEQTSREIVDADHDLLRIARFEPERLQDRGERERLMARNLSGIAQAASIAYIDAGGEQHIYAKDGAAAGDPGFPAKSADGLTIRDGSDREKPGLFLKRSLRQRANTPAGAIIMRLSEDHLASIYRAWRGESATTISLTTKDYRTLLQYPASAELAGKPFPALSASGAKRIADDATVRYIDPVDGRAHLVASQPVPGFRLAVHASAREDDVLADWTLQAALLAGAVLALAATALLLARGHAAELARRAAALGQLQTALVSHAERDMTHANLADAVLGTETRIATLLSHARTSEEITQHVVTALCSLGFPYGHWVTRNRVSREWDVRARHLAAPLVLEQVAGLEPAPISLAREGVASMAWRTGEAHWRVEAQPGLRRRPTALAAGLRSWVAVPLRSGGKVAAVIELFSPSPDPRNPTLESALHNIALQVGHLLTRLDAEQQLQTIVRTVPSAVFRARRGERGTVALSFISAQIETLWGVPAQMAVEHSRRVLWKIPRAHRRQLLQGLSEAVLEGTGWDVTVPIRTPHGMRWLRIHAAPAEEEGPVRAWDGIISDVTEQKLAERQVVLLNLDLERRVAERTQELAELNTELEAFTVSVSHDLRAPLRGMRGYAALLRSSALTLPADAVGLLDRIIAQGEHMDELIEALLELSQISRSDLRRIDTDMSDIASSTLQGLQSRDAARSVRWSVEPGMRAYADPRLMRILFENLLGNAWKFTRDNAAARIEVGCSSGARNTFFIRDNGAGFDPAYAERLFQPFQRLHPASRFEGTGIGLATVQRIVRRHGGRIWAKSKPDEGATFYFELRTGESVESL